MNFTTLEMRSIVCFALLYNRWVVRFPTNIRNFYIFTFVYGPVSYEYYLYNLMMAQCEYATRDILYIFGILKPRMRQVEVDLNSILNE